MSTAQRPPARPPAPPAADTDADFQLSNHQLCTAIMNTINCLRPSAGGTSLMPETAKLLNEHLAELQQIERDRARLLDRAG